MRLRDWLDTHNKTVRWFADRCGTTVQAVYAWREGSRLPQPHHREIIAKITKGQVAQEDFVAAKEEFVLDRARRDMDITPRAPNADEAAATSTPAADQPRRRGRQPHAGATDPSAESPDDASDNIADALFAWRTRLGFSQGRAAVALGISRRTLETWERGMACRHPAAMRKLMRYVEIYGPE